MDSKAKQILKKAGLTIKEVFTREPATAPRIPDNHGNEWIAIAPNEFQQRQLQCVSGPRTGDIILDPRCGPPEPRPPYKPPMDPWLRGLYKSDFFD